MYIHFQTYIAAMGEETVISYLYEGRREMKRKILQILFIALSCSILVSPLSVFAAPDTNSEESNYVGSVDMSGDQDFDSDSIVNADERQWRWLGYPESRIVVNPNPSFLEEPIYDGGLNLNIGLFVNGVHRKNSIQKLQIGDSETGAKDKTGITTKWYPYKLTADVAYGDSDVEMTEFFVDKNTFVRLFDMKQMQDKVLVLSAQDSGLSVLDDGSLLMRHDDYSFIYKIIKLNADTSVNQIIAPVLSGSDEKKEWKVIETCSEDIAKYAFVMTLAVEEDGEEAAIERSNQILEGTILDKLSATKAFWDGKLAKVPAPENWGIGAGMDAKGVTPEQHRRAFYAAWAFKYQNIIEPTPETDYPYYQVTLGMPSMWSSGTWKTPNSCAWESMFDIQQLAMVEPEIAWSAAEGFINEIDENGILDGECLPSQKAHMVWVCYENLPDKERLERLYPNIKNYLLWRAENPRWIYGSHDYKDEKDISFVTQWYSDVSYAIKMCEVLEIPEDIAMWEARKEQMDRDARIWFFTPAEGAPADKIYNICFADSGEHYNSARPKDIENYIISALYADFPADMEEKLIQHYIDFYKPDEDLVGFDFYKYGDGCHIAYGLLEKVAKDSRLEGYWETYINSVMRNIIKSVQFCEESRPGDYSQMGVAPSSFSASSMVDFTYMSNGMRIDLGQPAAVKAGRGGIVKTAESDITVYTITNEKPQLPKTVKAANNKNQMIEAYVKWNKYDPEKLNTSGQFTVTGTLADSATEITATVKVYGGALVADSVSAVTLTGRLPELPKQVITTYMADEMEHKVMIPVVWGEVKEADFAEEGTVMINGTLQYQSQPIIASVQVIRAPVIKTDSGKYEVNQYESLNVSLDYNENAAVTWSILTDDYDALAGINKYGKLLAAKPGTVTVSAWIAELNTSVTKEIEILPVNTVSFAYSSQTTASPAVDSTRTAEKAVDEDYFTRWRAKDNFDNQFFQLEMEQELLVDGVKIRWYEGNQPKAYNIQVSENGTDWRTVYSQSNTPGTGRSDYTEIIVFEQTESAKFVKMESIRRGDFAVGIIEFQVMGTADTTIQISELNIESHTGIMEIDKKNVPLKLEAKIEPEDAGDKRVEWRVTDLDGESTDAAVISPTGVLSPLKNGTVKVSAYALDGSGVEDRAVVEITNQDLENIALNKPASASTSYGSPYLPASAVDGNRDTRWGSSMYAPQNSWFEVDLEKVHEVHSVMLYFDIGAYPVDYKMQYAVEKGEWKDIEIVTDNMDLNPVFLLAESVDARYVRIISSATSNKEWGYSISEFEIYGRESKGNEAPYWPEGSTLSAVDIMEDSVRLIWNHAADDHAVSEYQIYMENKQKGILLDNATPSNAHMKKKQEGILLDNATPSDAYMERQECIILADATPSDAMKIDVSTINPIPSDSNALAYQDTMLIGTLAGDLNKCEYLVENLAAGETYYFKIIAVDEEGLKSAPITCKITTKENDKEEKTNYEYLKAVLALAERLDKTKYQEDSYEKLNGLLIEGHEMVAANDSTQGEVDALIIKIHDAVAALEVIPGEKDTEVDYTKLESIITEAGSYMESSYTKDSWGRLNKAVAHAKALLTNEEAEQEAVDQAERTVWTAIRGLVDITGLLEEIESGMIYKKTDYTVNSYQALADALTEAKELLEENDPTKSKVSQMIANVRTAIRKLEKYSPSSSNGGGLSGSGDAAKSTDVTYQASTGNRADWHKDSSGWWLSTEKGYAKNEWKYVGDKWYFFNNSGYMVTGWQKLDKNKWYYMDQDGAMVTGWLLENGTWYYLNASGDMRTTSLWYKDKLYFFGASGNCTNP